MLNISLSGIRKILGVDRVDWLLAALKNATFLLFGLASQVQVLLLLFIPAVFSSIFATTIVESYEIGVLDVLHRAKVELSEFYEGKNL